MPLKICIWPSWLVVPDTSPASVFTTLRLLVFCARPAKAMASKTVTERKYFFMYLNYLKFLFLMAPRPDESSPVIKWFFKKIIHLVVEFIRMLYQRSMTGVGQYP